MRVRPAILAVATALVLAACSSDDSSSTTTAATSSDDNSSTTTTAGDGSTSSEAPPTSSPGGEDFDTCMEDKTTDLALADVHAIADGDFASVSEEGLQVFLEATGECGILTAEADVPEEDKDCMATAWNSAVARTNDLATVAEALDTGDTASAEATEFLERWAAEISLECPDVTEQDVNAVLNA